MSRACQYSFAGRSGPAEWSFDEISLIVSPAGGRPLVFPVKEIAGIAGDGFAIEIAMPAPAVAMDSAVATTPRLTLFKLGAEGSTLLDSLQRVWLVARAKALRLDGSGEGKPFSGVVAGIDRPGGVPEGVAGEDVPSAREAKTAAAREAKTAAARAPWAALRAAGVQSRFGRSCTKTSWWSRERGAISTRSS
jgi:hypothetical protein